MKISNSVIIAVLLISVMSVTTEARPFYLLGATGVIPAIMLQVRVTFSKNFSFTFSKVLKHNFDIIFREVLPPLFP